MRIHRLPFSLLAGLAAIAVLGGPGAAGQGAAPAPQAEQPAASETPRQAPPETADRVRATDVIGRTVENPKGESVGAVEDLVIAHSMVYAIVSVGGFLGVGEKLIAVPYDELRPGGEDILVLDASRQELERRPSFEFRAAAAGDGQTAAADGAQDYQDRIGAEIESWAQKVSEFTGDTARQGEQAGRQAADKVDAAWDEVQTQWNRLGSASAEAWDDTKAAFERAWNNFQRAWRDATAES